MKEKDMYDQISNLNGAKEEKALEIVQNMLRNGVNPKEISHLTGLSEQIVMKARQQKKN